MGRGRNVPWGRATFDLQAHCGGRGLVVENTLAAFGRALDLGVSSLEFDVQITKDGHAVVTHDRKPDPHKCLDTRPASPDDPAFPYLDAGLYIKDLTLAQVRSLDCGSLVRAGWSGQQTSPGARMPLLTEVLSLIKARHARRVTLNVEIKVEAGAPEETAPRQQFVDVVAHDVSEAGLSDQVVIQSFDWGALMSMRQLRGGLPIVALTNGQPFLQAGMPGLSPWLGGLDIDDFGGDPVAAAHSFGAAAISPVHGDPHGSGVSSPDYTAYTTERMVDDAHAVGMRVIPWTVNDIATMQALINIGVDGITTDYPDRLRDLMAKNDLELPERYPVSPEGAPA